MLSDKQNNEEDSSIEAKSRLREIALYIMFGGLTTLVNYITFRSLYSLSVRYLNPWSINDVDVILQIINIIAWAVAVTFAFIVNRIFVFKSSGNPLREFFAFVSARIVTLVAFEIGLFMLLFFVLENGFGIPKETEITSVFGFRLLWIDLIKIGVAVFVIIANYFFSKIFIFKKSAVSRDADEEEHIDKEADSVGTSK